MQRIEKTISDFLPTAQPVVTLDSQACASDAARIMASQHTGCVLVEESGQVAGIFTERDWLYRIAAPGRDPEATPLAEVMTRNPETLSANDRITYAINKMAIGGYRQIPIVDSIGKPVAVLAIRNVVEHLADVFDDAVPDGLDEAPFSEEWIDLGGG